MAQFRPKSVSLKAPSFGKGADNQLMAYILSQQKGEDKSNLKSQERGNIGTELQNIKNSLGRDFNPGESVSIDGASITPNPKLDTEQSKAVAASELYPGIKNQAVNLIKQGTLNSKNGLMGSGAFQNADRTVRQFSAEQSNPLGTYYDQDLQRLQSKMQKLKELMFDRGGTALTPTEQSILGSAFILHGKTDQQILEDIGTADSLVESKARLALGGANAARSPIPGMPGYKPDQPQQEEDQDPLGLFK